MPMLYPCHSDVFSTRLLVRLWPVLAFVLGDLVGVTATDLAQIPMSPDLGTTLARGSEFATAIGAREVTLEHLLFALCDDSDAIAVLDASHINIERLRADITEQVLRGAQNPATTRGGFGVSQDVRRILEAAAAAARGSRRRDINGAIVLAAIVGDARSTAAEILQTHGLNFDGAIRALQASLAQAPARDVPVADDVLARARERVQSRATPSLREIMKDMPRPVPPPPSPIAAPELAEKPVPAPAAPAAVMPPTPEPTPPTPAAPVAVQPSLAPTNEAASVDPGPSWPVPEVDVPRTITEGKGAPAAAPAAAPEPAPAPAPPVQAPVPAAPPVQRGPAEAGTGRTAQTEPALPFPMPQAGGYQPMPQNPVPGMRAEPLGHGREFPDFTRERRVTATPPPIPPSTSMPAPPPGARGRGPALGFPAPPPSLRIEHPAPNAAAPQAPQPQRRTAERRGKATKVEAGKLAENIPRAMRVGRTERAEIRIAKASVKALTEGLEGGGPVRHHNVAVTKAMAVRMRAPEGGFFIESASPETQWIENSLGYASDDFASWRFLITPQSRGWARLQIIVSARTVGADGVAAETALPDQVVEVKVRRNLKRAFARLLGWTIAAVLGGALSTFGQTGLEIAKIYAHRFMH
jgi:neural Wiskott-Aldrich syndrome protein